MDTCTRVFKNCSLTFDDIDSLGHVVELMVWHGVKSELEYTDEIWGMYIVDEYPELFNMEV